MQFCKWFISGILIACAFAVAGQDVFILDQKEKYENLNAHLSVLEDPDKTLTISGIRKSLPLFLPYSSVSKPLKRSSVYWGKILLRNKSEHRTQWILFSGENSFVEVHTFGRETAEVKKTGRYVKATEKDLQNANISAVSLTFLPGEQIELFIRIEQIDGKSPVFDLRLEEKGYWLSNLSGKSSTIQGIFQGMLWIMLLYTLITYASTLEKSLLFYVLYLLATSFYLLHLSDSIMHSFLRTLPFWDMYLWVISSHLLIIAYFQFGRHFLESPANYPQLDKIVKWVNRGIIASMGLGVFLCWLTFNEKVLDIQINIVILVLEFSLLYVIVKFLRSPDRLAQIFAVGSLCLFFAGVLGVIADIFVGIQKVIIIVEIAIIAELLAFAFGLGYRLNMDRVQKLNEQKRLTRKLLKTNKAIRRFVPSAFIEALGAESIQEIKLGDQILGKFTVFFSDIRSYMSIAEQMTPEENFNFLNAFHGRIGPIIKKNSGFINQYFGDGIMALFQHKPDDAISAAIQAQDRLLKYNRKRLRKGRRMINIGIGLHTGPLILGILGDKKRLEAGVVSDAVNTASRLEGLTKFFGCSIIASESTIKGLEDPDRFNFRHLGKVQVKGKIQPIGIYECFDGDTEINIKYKIKSRKTFNKALEAYFSGYFEQAVNLFSSILEENPEDNAAKHFLEKSAFLQKNGVPEDWDGVEYMTEK